MFVTVKSKIFTDSSGVYTELPVLLTSAGVLEPLLDYCLYRSHDRSLAWMSKVCRSVRMFIEYLQTNPAERDTYRLFQNFAQRLYTGTFDRETGLDPSGLCWPSRSPQDASHIVTHLSDFFDWLGEMRPEAVKVNPRYAGGAFDRQTDEAAYQYRRSKAFLGHTWATNASPAETRRRVRGQRLPKVERGEPPAFPEERFEELLFKGFKAAGHHDYRGMLITLLLHGAGFRESEPFHLYISDVFPSPAQQQQARVHIHHPSHGYAPTDWRGEKGKLRKGNRAEYLARQFDLAPRTELMDRRHAGWKGGTHDAPYYKQAYWFLPEYGELFQHLWLSYLEQVARIERNHPFAFINLRRAPLGAMYTLTQYNKAHAAACERIGLTVGKALGTTPHGHRHAYCRRLSNAGIDKALIRRFMHHASLESQEVYTQANTREALAALEAAAQRLRDRYPNACFLFRAPEAIKGERHLPIRERGLDGCWFRLLQALELRLADRGESHRNGTPIRFLPPPDERNNGLTTFFPLHSLRVSLITALALEGQVPFPVLQKLVGHSRLLMTLYYTKPGATHIRDVLLGAAERLEANKETGIHNFLLDTEHEELLKKAICNSVPSLAAAIPQHPAARNAVGWMPMHHGLCLVGGNTSEVEENGTLGGCYNGGPNIASPSSPKYGAVPGGSRNCVRCRWFVTEPHYLPALAAHFNTLAYHFDESRNACLIRENELQDLKRQKADAEEASQPFARQEAYRQAERVWESAMKRFSDLAEDLVACWRLIERCKAALETSQGDGTQLVAAGTVGDVKIAFEETESELLQLAGVCESVEVYHDLEPGKAVFRRSQLLDAVFYRDDLPPVFMLLSEQEQLIVGNAFMRRLSQQMNPANPALGQREVVRLMDAGERLSQHFDVDLSSLLPMENRVPVFHAGLRTLTGADA